MNFFYKESKAKKNNFFGRGGGGEMDRQTNRPNLITPFNFFEAGA